MGRFRDVEAEPNEECNSGGGGGGGEMIQRTLSTCVLTARCWKPKSVSRGMSTGKLCFSQVADREEENLWRFF